MLFFDVNNAMTITTPAKSNKYHCPDSLLVNATILYVSGFPSSSSKCCKEERSVNGIPIKLTRSFPTKANARENVPQAIMTFSIFTPMICGSWGITKKPPSIIRSKNASLEATQFCRDFGKNAAFFKPLTRIK
mgnify:CR=1 FL=1